MLWLVRLLAPRYYARLEAEVREERRKQAEQRNWDWIMRPLPDLDEQIEAAFKPRSFTYNGSSWDVLRTYGPQCD